jgi:hypothetical protein
MDSLAHATTGIPIIHPEVFLTYGMIISEKIATPPFRFSF